MKKSIFFLVLILTNVFFVFAQNKVLTVGNNSTLENDAVLIQQSENQIIVQFQLNKLELHEIFTDYGKTYIPLSGKAPLLMEKGAPELLYLTSTFIIPDIGSSELEISYNAFTEYENIEIAPSKGHISRSVDPSTIPFEKGEIFNQDAFFPKTLANLREPFILRDVRGQSLDVYPIQYNPITKVLRVYSEITVTITNTQKPGINEFTTQKRHASIDPEFAAMYSRMFINSSTIQQRGYPTGDEGDLLIVCFDSFMDEMKPYVDWKRTIGRKTILLSKTEAGSTNAAIKTTITNFYNNPANNLTHVLLVGDAAQIPYYTLTGGSPSPAAMDIAYGQINSGNYLDILVGRISAENSTHVQTQVQRTIEYERDMTTADTWLTKSIGIAANEGSGGGHDGGEADYVHMNNIRTRQLDNGYSTVHQEYTSNCGVPVTNNSQISQRFNDGVSVGNYCNHGSPTAWTLTGGVNYSNTQVNALQNVGKLPFLFSVACNNGEFHNNSVCFAEAWMRASQGGQPTGAIAVFMATISLSWLPPMSAQDEFVDLYLGITHTAGGFNYGIADNNIKTFAGLALNASQRMIMKHGASGTTLKDYQSWTVFGDPTLQFRTKTPQSMAVTHDLTIPNAATSFTVNCNAEGALVALTYTDDSNNVVILGTATVSGGVATINNFSQSISTLTTLKVAVTGFNKVTYQGNVTVQEIMPQFCEKPTNLSANATGSNAELSWSKPAPIDGTLIGYNVYRDNVKIGETMPEVTQYTDFDLDNGTYVYKVSANYQHCPESALTNGETVIINVVLLCDIPLNFEVETNDAGTGCKLNITWDAPENTEGLLGFNVYCNGTPSFTEYDGSTNYSVTSTLEYGTSLQTYKVSAKYVHCAESEFTQEKSVECPAFPDCVPPYGIEGVADGNSAIITWNEPENETDILLGYNIYKDGMQINTEPHETTEFRDTNLNDGTYIYQVSAVYEECEESEKTEEATVVIVTDGINSFSEVIFEMFPNPATGEITFKGDGLNRIEIYEVQGRKLAEYNNLNNILQINVNQYQNGVYLVKMFSSMNQVVVKRLVILR